MPPDAAQPRNKTGFPGATVAATVFRGWNALRLANGLVEAGIVPEIGGRVMAFNLGDYVFLWVNPALEGQLFSPEENQGDGSLGAWKNYGGAKTWPAPQGWSSDDEWHGPPDPVLDTGRYTVEVAAERGGAATVRLKSPADPRTGVSITRQFTLRPNQARAVLHLEMKNESDRPRRWALWEVVQVDATRRTDLGETHNDQAWVYVPANPESVFPGGYHVIFGADDNPQWQRMGGLIAAQYRYQVGKIAVDSRAGWVAFVNQASGFAFIQRFQYLPGEPYPDGGATVECWTTGLGAPVGNLDYARNPQYHLEAEVLGPLRLMQPGEAQSFDIEWCACRCPGPIVNITEAGATHAPLTTEPEGSALRLRGMYGVFEPGTVRLAWLDAAGIELAAETLGPAHPLEVLRVDVVREAPKEWESVELALAGDVGVLDRLTRHL